jgi:hypothetical protein
VGNVVEAVKRKETGLLFFFLPVLGCWCEGRRSDVMRGVQEATG